MYNLNVARIVKLLLPPTLRKGVIIDFLLVPYNAISNLINDLRLFKEKTSYYAQFNSQTIVLQHLLNDLYDPTLRRIYIQNTANILHPYLYHKVEQQPPKYLYKKNENHPFLLKFYDEYISHYDFIVYIPNTIANQINTDELSFYINHYKIAGKLFNIQTY